MEVYEGKSVCGGIAIGKIRVYRKNEQTVHQQQVTDPEGEINRYRKAKEEAREQFQALCRKAREEAGETGASIMEGHRMILEDPEYNDFVENMVRNHSCNAEYAVAEAREHFSDLFAAMDDAYMRAREADVRDVSKRLLLLLGESGNRGGWKEEERMEEPFILVADDLTPSETVQLDKGKVLSFVTVHGSRYSHTAILAHTMAIPALVGTSLPQTMAVPAWGRSMQVPDGDADNIDGKLGIVDGENGIFYVDPDKETLDAMRTRQKKETAQKEKEAPIPDGQGMKIYANIGNIRDLAAAVENGAAGIGLFRSECLYLERETYPTEEEQFCIYRQAAERMEGKPVIIRTLDIGADKKCDYFELEPEENPALGCRAIRICLTRPEIFKTQLRALFRASVFGNIAVMYPMIISVDEVRRIKKVAAEVAAELTEQNIAFRVPEQGIMIETPAAALISDELAKEVDFFSIGTNDLTQYTLAIDRQNDRLDAFYDPHHPAVLRMIAMVVENAHREGIRAGICGELGADLSLTQEFLAMGVDELSVSPGSILPVRRIVLQSRGF